MAGLKRKPAVDPLKHSNGAAVKKLKTSNGVTSQKATSKPNPKSKLAAKSRPASTLKANVTKKRIREPSSSPEVDADDLVESDTTEDEHGFYGFSAKEGSEEPSEDYWEGFEEGSEGDAMSGVEGQEVKGNKETASGKDILNGTSSKEAHAKQKALAKERKAAKPNANEVDRTKRIWDTLRLKSGVSKEERAKLVDELLDIVRGRMREFVFKHDVVRTIQSAAKYGNMEQRRLIARELKGEYKALAESKYAKFLVAKLLVEGDTQIREMIIPEFYGHIKRLINHPEASWIVDDVYRQMATKEQKAKMLREWYGPEYAIFKSTEKNPTAELAKILEHEPEKRKPIMKYLFNLVNQLIQKRLSGFSMLHDAMLQYFINTKPGTEEASAFLELIKGEEEVDLLKNLAFTRSGSRFLCLALAYGSAKDRKNILRTYKELINDLATDEKGHMVLLAALDVTDDTKLTGKSILTELVGKDNSEEDQIEKIVSLAGDLNGRIPLLYPFAGTARWLIPQQEQPIVTEFQDIRKDTSKKDPVIRQKELALPISSACLRAVELRASNLIESSFGCQFMTAVLCGPSSESKTPALTAVADAAISDSLSDEAHSAQWFQISRMLRTLVQGGEFNAKTQTVGAADSPKGFANLLFDRIKDEAIDWACGDNALVLVNMLERAEGFERKEQLLGKLREGESQLKKAATEETTVQRARREEIEQSGKVKGKKGKAKERKGKVAVGNPGSRRLLELLEEN